MATQDKEFSQVQKVNVVVSKAPIISPIFEEIDSGKTLRSIFQSYSGLSENHSVISVNGNIVEDWEYVTKDGDYVSVSQIPQEPTTIAVVSAIITVVSAVAGYLLYQPPEGPTPDEKTNRISGPRNEAAKYDPVPVVLGERRTTPPYAANPYTDWAGNQEYLNMLLCAANGPVDLSEIKIGDTVVTDYEEVSVASVDGYNNKDYSSLLSVWKAGVLQENVSSELTFDSFITRTSATDSRYLSLDIAWPQGLRGQTGHRSDAIEIQYQIGSKWYVAVRPRTDNNQYFAVGSVVRDGSSYELVTGQGSIFQGWKATGFNIVDITSALAYYDSGQNLALFDADLLSNRLGSIVAWEKTSAFFVRGFRFQPVDLSGNPLIGNVSVRVRKAIDEDIGSANDRKTAQWLSFKSERDFDSTEFLNSIGVNGGNPDFTPAIIALRVRATDQLNGVIDNLNCKITSVVPTDWSKDWSTIDVATEPMKLSKNPAELFRWVLQGNSTNIRVSNDKIDIAGLETWRDRCTTEGWETSEYINYETTLKQVLDNVAFTGRAEFSYKDGKFSVVEKIERTVPRQIFTPKNSSNLKSRREFRENYDGIKFKFQNINYEDQVDEGTYYDPYKFANNDPEQPLPGITPSGTFKTVEFWGVVDPDLAQRHARFLFFEEKLRREIYELETDIESLVSRRGDLVRIAHDVIDVGIGQGFITQDVTASTTFFMDETKDAVVGDTYYFQVRSVDNGTIFSEFSADYEGGGEWTADSPQTFKRGDLAVYGEQGKESLDCIIVGVENLDNFGARLTLVNAANEIFDEDAVALPTYETGLTPRADFQAPLTPVVNTSDSGYSYDQGFIAVQVEKNPAETQQIEYFSLRYRTGDEGVTETVDDDTAWNSAGTVAASDGVFRLPADKSLGVSYWVQARAFTRNLSSAWSDEINVVINADPSPDVNDFTITEQTNTPKTPDGQFSTLVIEVDEPASPAYLYAIAEYRLAGQPEWFEISKIGWKFNSTAEVQVFSDGIQYEIRVRTVNIFGVANENGISKLFTTTNVIDPEYTDENPYDVLPVPNITGLELFEQGNDTEFVGRDAKFVWRRNSVGDYVELGNEGLRGASSSRLDQYFRDYQVEIWADNKIVRTEFVYDPIYTYTYEKNAEDYKREVGSVGAWREFQIRVYERGRNNQISQKAAVLDVSNTAPEALSALSVTPGYSIIEIDYQRPTDLDFAGVDIWVSETQGFDPDATEPTATVSDNSYVVSGLNDGTTYYVRLRPFDLFGKTGTNTSSEFTVVTKTGQDLSGLSGWAYELDPVDEAFIEDNLAGDAIPSTKIKNLTAAKITTGTLLATETITSEGLIRAVDDINSPQYQVGIGPLQLNDDGQGGSTPTTYLLWGYDNAAADGEKLKFGVDELGNAYFKGDITGASGTFSGSLNVNDNFIVDASGNVNSTGTFRFGGSSADYIEFDGTNLIVDTPFMQFDSTSAILGNEATGEYIKYEGGVFEVGPNATIGSNENRTVTVGVGKDFLTINDALEYLSRTVPAYKSGGFTAIVLVDDGHTETSGLDIVGVNLGFVTIKGQTDSSFVTFSSSDYAIRCRNGAIGPKIDISITASSSMSESPIKLDDGAYLEFTFRPTTTDRIIIDAADSQYVIRADNSSRCVAERVEVKSCYYGAIAYKGSHVNLFGSIVRDYIVGFYAEQSSQIIATDCDLIDCKTTSSGVISRYAMAFFDSNINLYSMTQSGSVIPKEGVFAQQGSKITVGASNLGSGDSYRLHARFGGEIEATNCTGSSATSDVFISTGSIVRTGTGMTSISGGLSFNTLYKEGIVFQT